MKYETVFEYYGKLISKYNILVPNIQLDTAFIFDSKRYIVQEYFFQENEAKDCLTLIVLLKQIF